VDVVWECWGMMDWDGKDIPGWNLLADFSVEHACVLTTTEISMIHRRYKAAPLREIGVIVSRPA